MYEKDLMSTEKPENKTNQQNLHWIRIYANKMRFHKYYNQFHFFFHSYPLIYVIYSFCYWKNAILLDVVTVAAAVEWKHFKIK